MTHSQVANAQPFTHLWELGFLPYKHYVERSQSTIVSLYPQGHGSPVPLVRCSKTEMNPIASSLAKSMAIEEGQGDLNFLR